MISKHVTILHKVPNLTRRKINVAGERLSNAFTLEFEYLLKKFDFLIVGHMTTITMSITRLFSFMLLLVLLFRVEQLRFPSLISLWQTFSRANASFSFVVFLNRFIFIQSYVTWATTRFITFYSD